MSAEVIPFGHKTAVRLTAEEAWAYFDEAQMEALRLYRDPQSQPSDRMKATFEAAGRHRLFMRAAGALE